MVADGVVYSTFTSIYKLMPTGAVILLAGSGDDSYGYFGDGGPATLAQLFNPMGLAVDTIGAVLFADYSNNRVRTILPNGTITLLAGSGVSLYTGEGDGGPATRASLNYPYAIALNSSGAVFIAEGGRIRVLIAGMISTVPGIQSWGGVAVASDDALIYVSNSRLWRLQAGITRLIAGGGLLYG